jgi:hypothetical protein
MKAAAVSTDITTSVEAGQDLAAQITGKLGGAADAIILFAAPEHDHRSLLAALKAVCPSASIVGSSSAGEFTNDMHGTGLACALALKGDDAAFSAVVGRGIKADPAGAARQMASGLSAPSSSQFEHRAALVLTDALAGYGEVLVDELTLATAGTYKFFGGGAGDNARFERTTVFCGDEVMTDAAVALEILSSKPLGVGVGHGWTPASRAFRVTEVDGMRLVSLDGLPAIEAFEEFAEENAKSVDRSEPIPFFLHNILGIETGASYRLRVPLAVLPNGAVHCAAEIPMGAVVRIMSTTNESSIEAAEKAADAAVRGMSAPPAAALFFDCVATRLRMDERFQDELAGLKGRLGSVPLTGCNTHGQIARAEGQFEGFHNCTAVVCVFPE